MSTKTSQEVAHGEATQWIQEHGGSHLANRLRAATRARNLAAHPDSRLAQDVENLAESVDMEDRIYDEEVRCTLPNKAGATSFDDGEEAEAAQEVAAG